LVLLTLEPGMGTEVLERLAKIEGVVEAHFLYGPYDAYVMIEGENTTVLHEIIIEDFDFLCFLSATFHFRYRSLMHV